MMNDSRFYHNMVDYLIDREEYRKFREAEPESPPSYREPYELIKDTEGKGFKKVMDDVTEILKDAPYKDIDRYRSYALIDSTFPLFENLTVEFAFSFLFSLSDKKCMPQKAYEKFSRFFGLIVLYPLVEYCSEERAKKVYNEELQADVMESLPRSLLRWMSSEEIVVYEGDFYEDNDELQGMYDDMGDKAPWNDTENLLCCVCQLDQKEYKAFSDIHCIHAFTGGGMNSAGNLIGNMITYVNKKKPNQAITYQIVGRSVYPNVDTMLEDIGTKSFGFCGNDYIRVASKENMLEWWGDPQESYALQVIKLPYPILKPEDISAYSFKKYNQ